MKGHKLNTKEATYFGYANDVLDLVVQMDSSGVLYSDLYVNLYMLLV